jgi:hypothetical protein
MFPKNKTLGARLSRNQMKSVKVGIWPPGGGGCIPFVGACRRTNTCSPYTDGSPIFCTATVTKPAGTCSAVA